MATPDHNQAVLARAVSEIDLTKALNDVKAQSESGSRYTPEEILNLHAENQNDNNGEPVETVDLADPGFPLAEGVVTPAERKYPDPPPPTPATISQKGVVGDNDEVGKDTSAEAPSSSSLTMPDGDQHSGVQPAKKKKKKKKSSGINRKPAPTGFEEFFADAPITPDEHQEECDLYDIHIPFESRIQTCIQRYRARRNLDSHRANILTKYLMLGGVESTNKAFTGGLDQETLESATAEEIAALQATDYVRTGFTAGKYYDGSDKWVIDFEGVAKGFFSWRIPNMFPTENKDQIRLYCSVIRNFLNYVLHHRVCEDYRDDVLAARRICDFAEEELWAIKQLQSKLPGDFNVAASTLYGGRYENAHMGTAAWAIGDPNYKDFAAVDQGFDIPKAEHIFKTAVAYAGNDNMFQEVMKENLKIVKTRTQCYEVVGIERAPLETIEAYYKVTILKKAEGGIGSIKPLGVLKLKRWEGPGFIPEDFTDDEGGEGYNGDEDDGGDESDGDEESDDGNDDDGIDHSDESYQRYQSYESDDSDSSDEGRQRVPGINANLEGVFTDSSDEEKPGDGGVNLKWKEDGTLDMEWKEDVIDSEGGDVTSFRLKPFEESFTNSSDGEKRGDGGVNLAYNEGVTINRESKEDVIKSEGGDVELESNEDAMESQDGGFQSETNEDAIEPEDGGVKQETKEDVIESFWLEDEFFELCYVGLKMEVDVHELNVGVKFFDTIHGLYCSFLTILPNEKMIYWKDPVANPRPPPTEEDPEVEQRALDAIAEKELEEDENLLADKE